MRDFQTNNKQFLQAPCVLCARTPLVRCPEQFFYSPLNDCLLKEVTYAAINCVNKP